MEALMAADANIFAQYLRAPKSVNDYMAEMDGADLRREQLTGARRQNALQALVAQDTMDQRRIAGEDRARLRDLAGQSGGDTNKLIQLLRGSGSAGLMSQADTLEKGYLDRQKTEAEVGEKKAKTTREQGSTLDDAMKRYRGALDFIDTPDGAARWLQAQYADPVLGEHVSRLAPIEEAVARIPRDPQGFAQWRQQSALGMEKFVEQQRLQATQAETARHNRTSETLTARGQSLTDARAREGNDIKRAEVQMGGKPPPGYRWAGDGRLEAIPGGPGDKLPEAQQKQVIGTQNLSNAITEYRSALKSFGPLDALKPDQRARLGTVYNNMLLQAKEAYNLGVLNGPDYEILQSVVTDPRTLKGAVTSKAALDKQASELDRIMGGIAKTSGNRRPQDGAPAVAAGAAPAKAAGAFSDPDKEARYQAWKAQQGRQ
jgi:hypothetical protein